MKLINLKTNKLGQNFKYYEKIDSTQSEIWRLVDSNKIADGMLVMSNIQTNGQGTQEDLTGAGYNVNQSKIAIGSGGLTGKGFLNGTQTKLKILPFLSM